MPEPTISAERWSRRFGGVYRALGFTGVRPSVGTSTLG